LVGELWAIPIMLRLALNENLRRDAALLILARKDRDRATFWRPDSQGMESEPSKSSLWLGDLAKSRARGAARTPSLRILAAHAGKISASQTGFLS